MTTKIIILFTLLAYSMIAGTKFGLNMLCSCAWRKTGIGTTGNSG